MATSQSLETQMQNRKKGEGLNLGLDFHMRRGRQRSHRYRGHRANSFVPSSDIPLLVELRARHRTFQGAYARTALGNLGYALTILRLFDTRFYRIGLIFAILGALLLLISFTRDRHSRHDFADPRANEEEEEETPIPNFSSTPPARIFGRPFVTAGWIVIAVTSVVLVAEIGLMVLIIKL
ncbi:hypothetical protein L218DRAFT_929910 [Marasmius fiardii PR-910]|nr:hypothetical protein L218DRAFT_929910 [Marasmius fiardii PR-910]